MAKDLTSHSAARQPSRSVLNCCFSIWKLRAASAKLPACSLVMLKLACAGRPLRLWTNLDVSRLADKGQTKHCQSSTSQHRQHQLGALSIKRVTLQMGQEIVWECTVPGPGSGA